MKLHRGLLIILAAIGLTASSLWLFAQETPENKQVASEYYEYLTIRWGGRDNTRLIRPGGKVEVLREQLRKLERPNGVDERAFYMNVVMNGLSKEGYEFAGMTSDTIIMKRTVGQ